MLHITVNLSGDEIVSYRKPIAHGSVQQVMNAARLLHPNWTSITAVLVRTKQTKE